MGGPFDVETDKVSTEIPAQATGVVAEIRHQEGETVAINTVVAMIGPAGSAAASRRTSSPRRFASATSAPSPDRRAAVSASPIVRNTPSNMNPTGVYRRGYQTYDEDSWRKHAAWWPSTSSTTTTCD